MDAGNYSTFATGVVSGNESSTTAPSNNATTTVTDEQTVTDGDLSTVGYLSPLLDPQVTVMLAIRTGWFAVVIPVGVVGNLLSLLVVTGRRYRTLSCSVYMGALAVTNTITLLGQAGMSLTIDVLGDRMSYNQILVTLTAIVYAMFSAAISGVFIILSMLLDRVIAVVWPFKAKVLLSPRRAVIITSIICIVSLIYNSPMTFSAKMVDMFGKKAITMVSTKASAVYKISQLLFNAVLPSVVILVLNLIILCAVKGRERALRAHESRPGPRDNTSSGFSDVVITDDGDAEPSTNQSSGVSQNMRQVTVSSTNQSSGVSQNVRQVTEPSTNQSSGVSQNVRQITESTTNQSRMSQKERQLTLMTVVMSLCFLCLTVPKYAHQLVFSTIDWESSYHLTLTFYWSVIITQLLYVLHSAINFFLYFMTGSKFRADLRKLCVCKRGGSG